MIDLYSRATLNTIANMAILPWMRGAQRHGIDMNDKGCFAAMRTHHRDDGLPALPIAAPTMTDPRQALVRATGR